MKNLILSFLFALASVAAMSQKTVEFTKVTGGVNMSINGSALKFSAPIATFNCTSTSFSARINDQVYTFKTSDAITINSVVMTSQTGCDIADLLQTTVFNITTGGGGGGSSQSQIIANNNAGTSGTVQRTNDALKVNDSVLAAKIPALGEATKSNSQPVVMASDQVVMILTGQSAQTATVNNILTNPSSANATDVSKYRSFVVQVNSSATAGSYVFEGSVDNTNWVSVLAYDLNAQPSAPVSAVTPSAVNRMFGGPCMYPYMRLRIATALTGGSVQAISAFSQNTFAGTMQLVSQATASNLNANISTVTTLSQFLAAATPANAKTNASTTTVSNWPMSFNGTNWDIFYGNWNTTTGDAGAKTTTFNGATQTNYNARGARIVAIIGTVTGTTPTLVMQLQVSPDGGTTWLNEGSASTSFTPTSGNTVMIDVYPTNFSVAGATPAALTNGATQSVLLNATLPRTWRIVYTIGGTTPSITLTSVNVAYQL